MKPFLAVLFCLASALSAGAQALDLSADIVFLGEQHDNPAHHARQAQLVAELAPKALVFEMLTPEQASKATPDILSDAKALGDALQWQQSGWPDFSWYHPIFTSAPGAMIVGAAVPREAAREVMEQDVAQVFGPAAADFGLTEPLSEDQQATREALQMAAHCDALPKEMLPLMVSIQRLRDARLAEAALQAFEQTGGPVAVITGNGHARKDWGAPAALALAAPGVRVVALGQGETDVGAPDGVFDVTELSAPIQREDPCKAFLEQRGN
ncbi:ChaN family lipoprotein [Tropicibacter oceani]|uniref:ChaN family lipoprotein n=1 Tax=Tropicibacter oceani TaxID=3058420 RepID=A0ABY8QLF2_9RHOB|nr:ChaN family lipoprotein [Tropicibacter oceani]WGW05379.1 ChaN family lipoprotein [Tropicibacter oceani]